MTATVLSSELLRARAVRHGFSTRLGGVSTGPFATLNLALAPGDERAAVQENLRLFSQALEIDASRLYQTSQVHGSAVFEANPDDDRDAVVKVEADALVASDPRIAVGVRVADCVPILLFDEASGHVAAVHAGWRGVASGVIGAAAATLVRGVAVPKLVAAIGPCIGPCCFEVGDEVVSAILEASPGDDAIVVGGHDKPHLDLRLAVRVQLRALGLDDAHIEDVAGCTRCDSTRFFSYRRDGARSGRLLAAIAPR